MLTTDIADRLSRLEWETLTAAGRSEAGRRLPHDAALQRLVESDLLALQAEGAVLTARGRQVVISGSPRLWSAG